MLNDDLFGTLQLTAMVNWWSEQIGVRWRGARIPESRIRDGVMEVVRGEHVMGQKTELQGRPA